MKEEGDTICADYTDPSWARITPPELSIVNGKIELEAEIDK